MLVSLNVFNSTHMNQAVFVFRRYEDASLSYTGIDSHEGLSGHFGLYDNRRCTRVVGGDFDSSSPLVTLVIDG